MLFGLSASRGGGGEGGSSTPLSYKGPDGAERDSVFWTDGTVICGRLQEARKSS